MKILSLRFSCLASLREEVVIDFAGGAIGRVGLFGIIGPTGAGKSTILDAISLALYNATARGQGKQIVSRGKRSSLAEVEFSVGGGRYRASWSIKLGKRREDGTRARGAPPKMELARVSDGAILASGLRGPDSVANRVEELTGLDFTRFQQSVLLAQGQFDAFLRASQQERSELLEQITGTEIYSRVSQYIYQTHKTLRQRHAARAEAIGTRGAPDAEARGQLEAEREAARGEVAESRATLTGARQRLARRERLQVVDAQLGEIERRRAALRREVESFADEAARLAAHEAVAPVQADYAKLLEARERLSRERSDLAAEASALETARLALEAAAAERERARVGLDQAEVEAGRSRERAADVRRLGEEVRRLDGRCDEAVAKREPLVARLDALETEVGRHEQSIQLARDRLAQAERVLADTAPLEVLRPRLAALEQLGARIGQLRDGLEQDSSRHSEAATAHDELVAELRRLDEEAAAARGNGPEGSAAAALARLQQRLDELSEVRARVHRFGVSLSPLVAASEQQREAEVRQRRLREEIEQQERGLHARREALAEHGRKLEALGEELRLATQAYEAVSLTADLRTAHGHRLTPGAPCPLCGALEHPAADAAPTDDDLAKHGAKLERLRAEREQTSRAVERDRESIVELRGLLASQRGRLESRDLAAERAALDEQLSALREEHRELLPAPDAVLDAALVEELRTRYKHRDAERTALTGRREELERAAQLERARAERRAELRGSVATGAELLEGLAVRERTTHRTLVAAEKAFRDQLAPEHALPSDDSPAAFVTTVREALARRSTAEANRAAARDLIAAEQASLAQSTSERSRLTEDAKQWADQLAATEQSRAALQARRADLLGDAASAEEVERRADEALRAARQRFEDRDNASGAARERRAAAEQAVAARQTRVAELEGAVGEAEKDLSGRLERLGVPSLSALSEVFLAPAEEVRLRETSQQLEREQERILTLDTQLAQERTALAAKLVGEQTTEELTTAVERHERANEAALQRLGAATKAIEAAESRRVEHEAALAQLAEEAETLADWHTLNGLVGSATGHAFRQFAQRITLRQLVGHANRHLADFYPRFSLTIEGSQEVDRLEVYVCDHYEADQVREVATVSGGEKFLLSMALALGFSRMASGGLSVDTLFIDEGFGTLDGERLDRALTALERLRSSGKTIGIISHVESLRERLPVRVVVEPAGGGRSRVRIEE